MYSVQKGDTFDIIARKVYGDESRATLLTGANPGVVVLEPGTLLNTPEDPTAGAAFIVPRSFEADDTSVVIETTQFFDWESLEITTSMDGLSQLVFDAPFHPFNLSQVEFRKLFKPFTYKNVLVTVGGEVLFTGVLVVANPTSGKDRLTVSIQAYSKPGVLSDCTFPGSAFPVEFSRVGLKEIASILVSPFGVAVDFDNDAGAVFEKVGVKVGEKIFSFLAGLAQQRNMLIESTASGRLRFYRPVASGVPVARLTVGRSPMAKITHRFSPQDYYSHITGIESAESGKKGSSHTVRNERLTDALRPLTYQVTDVESGGLRDAVLNKMGRMFGNSISYEVTVDTWRDPKGLLWRPDTFISVLAPHVMIYSDYVFKIRQVTFRYDKDKKSAVLTLILPGSFEGEIPEALPWDV